MKNNITISVSGNAGTGKSHIIFLLKQFLREKGFEVELNDIDHPNETSFDNYASNYNEVVDQKIKNNSIIKLNELHFQSIIKNNSVKKFYNDEYKSYIELTRQNLQFDKIDKNINDITIHDFKFNTIEKLEMRNAEHIIFVDGDQIVKLKSKN